MSFHAQSSSTRYLEERREEQLASRKAAQEVAAAIEAVAALEREKLARIS